MKKLKRYIVINGIIISFGIRFGNSRHNFSNHVLVIGFENPIGINRSNIGYTIASLTEAIKEILDIGMDEYFLYI